MDTITTLNFTTCDDSKEHKYNTLDFFYQRSNKKDAFTFVKT